MKNIINFTLPLLCYFVPVSIASAAVENYTFDQNHTQVVWHINHFGFSNPSGKWLAQGSLSLDTVKPENSKVNVTIKIADLTTNIPELDKHLKSPSFFDVDNFPNATFISSSVKPLNDKQATVKGTLTLHGISKPVTLAVTLNKKAENPITNNMTVGFSATTKIKRSDFGITTLLPGLGDEVNLDIESEAALNK